MYLLFEVDGVDMVLFAEVAYIVVEVVEEDMEEDFDIVEVLEAYKYWNVVNNYFEVVGHKHFEVVEHKHFEVVEHKHFEVVGAYMYFVAVEAYMYFVAVEAYMYLNVVKVAEEVMAEEEPLVEEEDIQDFDKGLEAYMYLIYGSYYLYFLQKEDNRIEIHHYESSFFYILLFYNQYNILIKIY